MVLAGLLLAVSVAAALVPAGRASPVVPAFTVTLTATPDAVDPLQVSFHAGAVTGTPTAFNWTFGDGHFLNGTTGAYAAPVHRYASPGNYTVAVVVFEGASSASQAMVVAVRPAPLLAAIQVTNETGGVPRTVTFAAVLSGGTGTFRSVNWSFGDGGSGVGTTIQYSFVRSGDFHVVLRVVDSSGAAATSSTWVNVSAPSGPGLGLSSSATTLAALGVVAAAAGIGIGLYLGRWGKERASRLPSGLPPDSDGSAVPQGVLGGAGVDGGSGKEVPRNPAAAMHPPGAAALEPPEARANVPATRPRTNPAGAAVSETGPPADRPVAVSRTALFLSQRIVLHLAQLGSLGPDELAPLGFTQLGISQALRVRQNALTNVLRRLVAAGAVTEDVRHVRGQARRLKVYRLSPRGEALAHDLRVQGLSLNAPTGPTPPSPPPSGPDRQRSAR